VLGARWEQFNSEAAIWIKPTATRKKRRWHHGPNGASAAALLRTTRYALMKLADVHFREARR